MQSVFMQKNHFQKEDKAMFANREKKCRDVWRPRAGFTLLELIIVIGIIGVLSAILLGQFSGITESARATECLAHMRNLASAVQNYGMTHGEYPFAGDSEYFDINGKLDKIYKVHTGYISGSESFHKSYRTALQSDDRGFTSDRASAMKCISTYNCDKSESKEVYKCYFSVTNGAIWRSGARRLDDYKCPSHSRFLKGADFGWSYVMNSAFGYDNTKGHGISSSRNSGVNFGELSHPDKRLLFAELPWNSDTQPYLGKDEIIDYAKGGGESKEGDTRYDGVLQYDDNVNDDPKHEGRWSGDIEPIGVNHVSGKIVFAHVCFADGHTEKLKMNSTASRKDVMNLTAWLCLGYDVTYDASLQKWTHKKAE